MCGEEERKKITHTLDSGMNHHRLLEGCINASMSNGRRCNAKEREEVAKEKETIKTRGMESERKAKKRESKRNGENGGGSNSRETKIEMGGGSAGRA